MTDLKYTAGAPAGNECRVWRDGDRVLLEPHAEHVEGSCSCGVEPMVLSVDVSLSRVKPGCWLATRNDGAVLGHLTNVPEPAPWGDVLDAVIAALAPSLGAPSHDCRTHGPCDRVTWVRKHTEVEAWRGMDGVARVGVYADDAVCMDPLCTGCDGAAITLEALPVRVCEALRAEGVL